MTGGGPYRGLQKTDTRSDGLLAEPCSGDPSVHQSGREPVHFIERSAGANEWLQTFAAATARSCADADTYAGRIDALEAAWRQRLGRVRASSAVELLLDLLPGVRQPTRGRRHPPTTQHWTPALPRVRSFRRDRLVHRPRARTCQPHSQHRLASVTACSNVTPKPSDNIERWRSLLRSHLAMTCRGRWQRGSLIGETASRDQFGCRSSASSRRTPLGVTDLLT